MSVVPSAESAGARSRRSPLAWLALALIRLYQKWLSPIKGFRCAHGALHGGLTCSEFVRREIAARGVVQALAPARQRLRDCRAAAETLSEIRRADQDPTYPPRKAADKAPLDADGRPQYQHQYQYFKKRGGDCSCGACDSCDAVVCIPIPACECDADCCTPW